MTSINPAAKRHKSSTETSPAQVSVLQNRNLVAVIARFLNYEKPLSQETVELSRETLTSSSACKADFLKKVLRDGDLSERGNFKLACRLYRNIVFFEMQMPERALFASWYERFNKLMDIFRNSQFTMLQVDSSLKYLLKYFAYAFHSGKIKYLHNTLNPKLPISQSVFDMTTQGSQNILLTLFKTLTCDLNLNERKNFELRYSLSLLPSVQYDWHTKKLNDFIPGNRQHHGFCVVFRKEISPQEAESLKPVLENTQKAMTKLIGSKCIHFLPIAQWLFSSYFAVHVHIDHVKSFYHRRPTKPYHCIRVAASLIGALSHLHKLRIVANQALLLHDVYLDENYWAFLSNYTALALAEEHSEQNQKLFAEDICALSKILRFIILNNHRFDFMHGLVNQMIASEAERPSIDVVETTFIKLINENFRKPEDPKFTSLLEILKSQQLTQAE